MLNIGIEREKAKDAVAVITKLHSNVIYSTYFDRLKEEFEKDEVITDFVNNKKEGFVAFFQQYDKNEKHAIEKTIAHIAAELRWDNVYTCCNSKMIELGEKPKYRWIRQIMEEGDNPLYMAGGVILDD